MWRTQAPCGDWTGWLLPPIPTFRLRYQRSSSAAYLVYRWGNRGPEKLRDLSCSLQIPKQGPQLRLANHLCWGYTRSFCRKPLLTALPADFDSSFYWASAFGSSWTPGLFLPGVRVNPVPAPPNHFRGIWGWLTARFRIIAMVKIRCIPVC